MARIHISTDSDLPADTVLAAITDFSSRRPRLWPNIDPGVYEVHEVGADWADVTEGSSIAGGVWTRERYEWSVPGVVRATVQDSNIFRSGFWEMRASSVGGGSRIEIVQDLQAAMPDLLRQSGLDGVRVGFGGQTALAAETVEEARDNVVRLSIAALLVNLLFLVLFLRAIVAPLYLLAASVLALAASLGMTTWLFQSYLGYGELAYYIPFAAAVLLLSLGSDYNIFIVGRIWDEMRKRDVEAAVERAAPEAAGPITVAGLVLAGSFALLALIPLVPFRTFAFAMAAGILIDSFIVRSLLAPSLISLFSRGHGRERRLDVAPAPGAD